MTRILLIDDDNRLRRYCAALLRAESFTVVEAADGESGLTAAHRERPDLIVCDVNMPSLNGHGVLTQLRTHPDTQGVPFIFLTGDGDMKDLRKGMNLGADDYLVKPVEPEQLLKAVRARLERVERANAGHKPMDPANPSQLLCLGLTPREAEMLMWVAAGKTNADIATITNVQLTTVKKHLESVFQKIGVENRTAAAALATQKLGPFA